VVTFSEWPPKMKVSVLSSPLPPPQLATLGVAGPAALPSYSVTSGTAGAAGGAMAGVAGTGVAGTGVFGAAIAAAPVSASRRVKAVFFIELPHRLYQ